MAIADGPAGMVSTTLLTTRAARRRPRRSARQRSEYWWGLAMIAPLGIGLGVFYLWPIAQTVYYSFTTWGAFGGSKWTGLANYRKLIHDPQVWGSLRNTFIYTALVLLTIPIAMVLAAMLNQRGIRLKGMFRTLYFLPTVTMPAAIALVWVYMYNGDSGIINQGLKVFGITGPSWLGNPHTALMAIAVVGIWCQLGYAIVLYMAGLQAIPESLYEAAMIDGASSYRKFISVTVPMLSPTTLFVSVISVIGSMQMFDLVYLMIPATSPAAGATNSIVKLFYQTAFQNFDGGYAAAIVLVLLVIIGLLTALQFGLQRRWVHYND
jgi:multiple sugar transport system permease protein